MVNAAFEFVGRTVLIVHGREDPTDAECKELLGHLSPQAYEVDQLVVITLGGLLTSHQRRMVQPVATNIPRRIVVTSSPAAYGVIRALSWIGLPVETSPLSRLRETFESLGVPRARVLRLLRTTEALMQRVDPIGMDVLPVAGLDPLH